MRGYLDLLTTARLAKAHVSLFRDPWKDVRNESDPRMTATRDESAHK